MALWRYSLATVRYVFGDPDDDPDLDLLAEAVKKAGPDGLTLTQQHDLFSRHKTAAALAQLAARLAETDGYVLSTEGGTGGRPVKRLRWQG